MHNSCSQCGTASVGAMEKPQQQEYRDPLPEQEYGFQRCSYHPEVETGLACGKCGTYICPRCMVQTPVGAPVPWVRQGNKTPHLRRGAFLLPPCCDSRWRDSSDGRDRLGILAEIRHTLLAVASVHRGGLSGGRGDQPGRKPEARAGARHHSRTEHSPGDSCQRFPTPNLGSNHHHLLAVHCERFFLHGGQPSPIALATTFAQFPLWSPHRTPFGEGMQPALSEKCRSSPRPTCRAFYKPHATHSYSRPFPLGHPPPPPGPLPSVAVPTSRQKYPLAGGARGSGATIWRRSRHPPVLDS